MGRRRIVVATHGHCFDGLASAALFAHFRTKLDRRPITLSYRSCGYGPKMSTVPERWLSGDENAIVDFRFSPSRKLEWYFDHHPTAFASDEERERHLARSKRFFHDPSYGSCAKLIADVGRQRFGVDFEPLAELVTWAHRIDSASFATAEEAIDRSSPAMRIAAVVQQHGDAAFITDMATRLRERSLEDVAECEAVAGRWLELEDDIVDTRKRVEKALERRGDVAYADLSEGRLRASAKFFAYALEPECRYAVTVLRMKQHYKISIGYNPWSGRPRAHDIATLCRKHGGGGHPVVGAISLPLDRRIETQRLANAITTQLNEPS